MKLIRFKKTSKVVLGVLLDGVGGTYFTAENTKTLIPEGAYDVEVGYSPKFTPKLNSNVPLLYNAKVPPSRGIRIHPGNNASTESAGCILVGNGCSLVANKLSNSTEAFKQLVKNCGTVLEITSEV